jgi:hypothetical protein
MPLEHGHVGSARVLQSAVRVMHHAWRGLSVYDRLLQRRDREPDGQRSI